MGTLGEIVDRARALVRPEPGPRLLQIVRDYANQFGAATLSGPSEGLNVVTFHVQVPDHCRVINYVDVKHDHGIFDYRKLSEHLLWSASHFNPGTQTYFVTDATSLVPPDRAGLATVRLAMNPAGPMLERVKAMLGYVMSSAFTRDTVFLDTDAFPNRSLAPIFEHMFDVGVTYRTTPGFMPLNEGVIFCSARNPNAVRSFFSAYLGTYEALMSDPLVIDYYGDIQRWRGGQLSLSAVGCQASIVQAMSTELWGGRITSFPCTTYNYWVTHAIQPAERFMDRKFILHLKGDSKLLIDSLISYQRGRAGCSPAPLCAAE